MRLKSSASIDVPRANLYYFRFGLQPKYATLTIINLSDLPPSPTLETAGLSHGDLDFRLSAAEGCDSDRRLGVRVRVLNVTVTCQCQWLH